MPLTDLLPMLGRRSGVLEIWDDGKNASLWLETGVLRGAWVNQQNLDAAGVRLLITDLMKNTTGNFEFTMGKPAQPCIHPLDWSLEQILSNSVLKDEAVSFTQELPDAETQFQAIALDLWLEEPLFGFWQRAKPLLASGASASQIAQRLGLPLDKTRLYLHKLRLAGRVSPVRAYRLQPITQERKSLVSRLLAALFGRRS